MRGTLASFLPSMSMCRLFLCKLTNLSIGKLWQIEFPKYNRPLLHSRINSLSKIPVGMMIMRQNVVDEIVALCNNYSDSRLYHPTTKKAVIRSLLLIEVAILNNWEFEMAWNFFESSTLVTTICTSYCLAWSKHLIHRFLQIQDNLK